ncbi:MAG: M67 family metallopeptidase [bacterium]
MIIINEQQRIEIIEQVSEAQDNEACGILAGKDKQVKRVYKMTNTADDQKNCYFMDPKEQLRINKEIRQAGLKLIGIYHSHPHSEAYPSVRDVELAYYAEASYVIISLNQNKVQFRSFKIVDGQIQEEEVKT